MVEKIWPSLSIVSQAVGETLNKLDFSTSKKLEKYGGNRLEDSIKKYLPKCPEHLSNQMTFFSQSSCQLSPKFCVCGAALGGPKSLAYYFLTKIDDFYLIFRGH